MDFQLLTQRLKNDLDDIKLQNKSILKRAQHSIGLCRDSLSTLKKEVQSEGFKSIQDEIYFFKVIKKLGKKSFVDGFTTNPTLMRKSGAKNYKKMSIFLLLSVMIFSINLFSNVC